jgi:hypothetical protein
MQSELKRTAAGHFAPGGPGGPGRPKGALTFARLAREITKDGDELVKFWWGVVQNTNARMQDRLHASDLLAQRGFGKPLELAALVDLTGDSAEGGELRELAVETLRSLTAQLTQLASAPSQALIEVSPVAQASAPAKEPEQDP